MNTRFFAREEKESELSIAYYCGCHLANVLQQSMPVIAGLNSQSIFVKLGIKHALAKALPVQAAIK